MEFVTTSRYMCIHTVLIATDKWFFCFIPRVLWLKCQCGDHVSWSRSSVAFLSASSTYQGSHLMWAGTTAFHFLFSSVVNRKGSPPPVALCSTMSMTSSLLRFLNHTQQQTTDGRAPLDEWSPCCRNLYLTTHNTHKKQTSMPPVGFKPTIPAHEWLQTQALDCAATEIGFNTI